MMDQNKLRTIQMIQAAVVSVCIVLMFISTITLLNRRDVAIVLIVAQFELIAALVISLIYLVEGYKKSSAIYYKATLCFTLLGLVLQVVGEVIMNGGVTWREIITLLAIGCLAILILVKDLGENRTWMVFNIMAVSILANSVLLVLSRGTKTLPAALSMVFGIGTIGIMIDAKYQDKKARGRN